MTAITKNKKTKELAPKLRFSGYKEPWQCEKLSEYLTFKNGLNAEKEKYGHGVKYISVLDIINNDFIVHDKIIGEVEVTKQEFEKNLVTYGDILFQRSSETREEVGQANVYLDKNKNAVFGGFVIRGKMKKDYNPFFMNLLLKTSRVRNDITSRSGGSTRYNIGQDSLSEVNIDLPSLNEQKKIADFLTAVDKKIQQLTRKKELLEQYKKGVMQKIFNQEIRFKDKNGKPFPDWVEKQLGNISDVRDGTHDSPKYITSGYPLITSKNLLQNGKIDFSNVDFINEKDYIAINKRSAVDVGDILFGMIGTIGNPVRVLEAGFAIKNVALIKEQNELLNEYLIHFLKSEEIQKQFYRVNTGGTQKFIALGVIRELNIFLPTLDEQRLISDCLNKVNEKIEKIDTILTKTQEFKKGLLQQMFV